MFKPIRMVWVLALLAFGARALEVAEVADIRQAKEAKPKVQIAILLDNSGSMSGLIDQARSQLWKIVNEFATAKKDGKRPELQVALYKYGNGRPELISPLTTDLDKISEELFKITISGGDENCGMVIKAATENLAWSAAGNDYKAIFIAGNEPFTQGSVHYAEACKAAIAKGIIVNTIHCGSLEEGINGKWQDGAALADGKFLCIDQNQQVVHIAAPQDAEIAKLGVEVNKTYLAFGMAGEQSRERQAAQDKKAEAAAPGSNVQRAVSKASQLYESGQWDLVDALKAAPKKMDEMKDEELPAEMKKLSKDERKAYVEQKGKERAEIQARINTLNEERRKFVAEEMKKRNPAGNSLDAAVIQTVREQGAKKAYTFE